MLKRMWITAALLTIVATVLAACGGGASSTPIAQPQILLTTNPNPPRMGRVEMIVDVKDTQGRPLDGAEVLVLTSHTTMSGMDQRGMATVQGNGRYAITADMSGMSGEWLVTVQARKGDLNLAQDFRIEVK